MRTTNEKRVVVLMEIARLTANGPALASSLLIGMSSEAKACVIALMRAPRPTEASLSAYGLGAVLRGIRKHQVEGFRLEGELGSVGKFYWSANRVEACPLHEDGA